MLNTDKFDFFGNLSCSITSITSNVVAKHFNVNPVKFGICGTHAICFGATCLFIPFTPVPVARFRLGNRRRRSWMASRCNRRRRVGTAGFDGAKN